MDNISNFGHKLMSILMIIVTLLSFILAGNLLVKFHLTGVVLAAILGLLHYTLFVISWRYDKVTEYIGEKYDTLFGITRY